MLQKRSDRKKERDKDNILYIKLDAKRKYVHNITLNTIKRERERETQID